MIISEGGDQPLCNVVKLYVLGFMERAPMASSLLLSLGFLVFLAQTHSSFSTTESNFELQSQRNDDENGLCAQLIRPSGYPCSEHTTETEDGYLLGLQRVSSRSSSGGIEIEPIGPPVLLQHGLFQAGDTWFLNPPDQSLGFILADNGFDVWVGNVRGTRWSHGHVSLSERDKDFWDWSFQELAFYDLAAMISYVHSVTGSKVNYVGHSQGTIMALAGFIRPDIVDMVEAAALLAPISYLGHISSKFVLRMVELHLDKVIMAMGIHQLNFHSDFSVNILESICDEYMDCGDLLTAITGKNCCFNNSRVDFYLLYEPHPTSSKNLNHLFQLIRKGEFAMYDHGMWGNMKRYGYTKPPLFDIASINKTLPVWMGYGGNDALADVTDLEHTIKELKCKAELLYLDSYGHLDFILSFKANVDVYENLIGFFKSRAQSTLSDQIL